MLEILGLFTAENMESTEKEGRSGGGSCSIQSEAFEFPIRQVWVFRSIWIFEKGYINPTTSVVIEIVM